MGPPSGLLHACQGRGSEMNGADDQTHQRGKGSKKAPSVSSEPGVCHLNFDLKDIKDGSEGQEK